jgi:hypothetical protein
MGEWEVVPGGVDPALLSTDDEALAHIRKRSLDYINLVFDTAEEDLTNGDAATRAVAYKNVLPHLLAIARETKEEEDTAAAQALDEARRLLDEYKAGMSPVEE